MQSNNNNASKKLNNTPVYKTFCKVCQDSGKLISEYTNHNVRDRSGKTVCPTLLAQECRNCYQRGHTVKYCRLLKAAPEPVTKPAAKPVTKAKPMPKNVFMVFDDESDSDNEVKEETKQEDTQFPALQAATLTAQKKPVLNYGTIIDQVNDPEFARALAQAKANAKALAEAQSLAEAKALAEAKRKQEAEALAEARDARIKANAGKKFSWADAESDSEGSDDEEEYVAPKKEQKQQIEDNSAW
jgi:hypothetical protein